MLHWETSTREPSWSFFFYMVSSIRFKFSLSSVESFLFFSFRVLAADAVRTKYILITKVSTKTIKVTEATLKISSNVISMMCP